MYIKEQDKDLTIFIKYNNWQSEEKTLICGAPTKAQFILHELVSQIPSFWNYEKFILAYLKSRETEKLFWNQRKMYEGAWLKEKGNRFIKNGIFGDPKP